MDPRAITGKVSDECRKVAKEMHPHFTRTLTLGEDMEVDAVLEVTIQNPVTEKVEVTLIPNGGDPRWSIQPDHLHRVLEPGVKETFEFNISRAPESLDLAYQPPTVRVQRDYLTEGLRFPVPEASYEVPVGVTSLPAPAVPRQETVLALRKNADCLRIENSALKLPDGPLTVETWMNAKRFKDRQGLINKTENSEFGFFLNKGVPGFMVYLDGKYRAAQAEKKILKAGMWHHLAGVFDGSEVRLYVDGELISAQPAEGKRKRNGLPLLIGADVTKAGNPTDGLEGAMDEVRISTVARYKGKKFTPRRRWQSDKSTCLLLHMDGQVGTWVHDSSPAVAHPSVKGGARLVLEREK